MFSLCHVKTRNSTLLTTYISLGQCVLWHNDEQYTVLPKVSNRQVWSWTGYTDKFRTSFGRILQSQIWCSYHHGVECDMQFPQCICRVQWWCFRSPVHGLPDCCTPEVRSYALYPRPAELHQLAGKLLPTLGEWWMMMHRVTTQTTKLKQPPESWEELWMMLQRTESSLTETKVEQWKMELEQWKRIV